MSETSDGPDQDSAAAGPAAPASLGGGARWRAPHRARRDRVHPHHQPASWLRGEAFATLLVPLCGAQEALARLDARVAAAPALDDSATRGGEGGDVQRLPPLLVAARAAEGGMSTGIVDLSSPGAGRCGPGCWRFCCCSPKGRGRCCGSSTAAGGGRAVQPPSPIGACLSSGLDQAG
jgi:hypothetical protein